MINDYMYLSAPWIIQDTLSELFKCIESRWACFLSTGQHLQQGTQIQSFFWPDKNWTQAESTLWH